MKKAYETYKDSGIKWIGNVPSCWELLPVRHYVTLVKGTKPKELTDINAGFPYLTMDYLRGRDGKTTMYPTSIDGLELIEENEILVLWDGANAGEFLLSKKGYLGSTMAKITVNPLKYDKQYFYYLLKTIEKASKDYANGTTIPHFDSKVLTDYYYPCPSLAEQKAIAEFLDNKCGKIDSLVAELERQVADLEVLKKSEISHVVTKGLDSNVQMKYSDIEWLGEVPENWDVVPLKRALAEKMMYGANESAEYTNRDFPRYIRITDIDENGNLKDDTFKSLPIEKARDYLLQKGDVLFARSGATVGKTFLYNLDESACFAGYLIKAKCNSNVLSPFYLMQYTKSTQYDTWKNSVFAQATIQNIGADKYSMLPIPIPPLTEQHQIVAYLDSYCQKIDVTIKEIQAQISDLKSYKQSLISEAVTGKIKIID